MEPCPDPEAEGLAEGELDGLTLAEGETDAEGETEGLTDGLGLLMTSLTARCTTARSSEVPEDIPTFRAPCPTVVSVTTRNPLAPASTDCRCVLLAPAVGSVW
jgi:hypothetical protein